MYLQKINTFVIQDSTNTGKPVILSLLTQHMDASTIHKEKDKTSFHLDELPSATSVLFEEPTIDQTNIGTWKQLMEGATIYTDIKHSNKEPIRRLPIFVTTNLNLWTWHYNDIDPIKERCIFHSLTNHIKSLQNQVTPTTITSDDIYELFIKYFPAIEEQIENISKKNK